MEILTISLLGVIAICSVLVVLRHKQTVNITIDHIRVNGDPDQWLKKLMEKKNAK